MTALIGTESRCNMKELIGYWLIALAITTLFFWLEPVFTTKEKIKGVFK